MSFDWNEDNRYLIKRIELIENKFLDLLKSKLKFILNYKLRIIDRNIIVMNITDAFLMP